MGQPPVRVGIVGVGNCASSLVQGFTYYKDALPSAPPPGLMNVALGGYHIRDVVISCAFDIHAAKVGCDVSDAIFVRPNNTFRFADPPQTHVGVQRGPTLDGVGRYMADMKSPPVQVTDEQAREQVRRFIAGLDPA